MQSVIKLTKSQLAERLFMLDGKSYSLRDYPFMRGIFDIQANEVLLKTGRQVTKSTVCACMLLAEAIAYNHFKILYIAPLREQTSRFSNTRLSKLIYYSPLVRNAYTDSELINNVLLQILKNGSEIALSYAWDDPDRVRSISADHLFIDEVQDIIYDNVIPVVKECMGNSDYGYTTYAGTPKTMENTIEFLWQRSTKAEWIMKCQNCNTWQYVDSVRSIGKTGIICVKCGNKLNPREGKWYEFNKGAPIKGFHISQLILPRNNEILERWQRILNKLETYSESRFKNEVLGISDAAGARMLTKEDLESCCEDYFVVFPPVPSVLEDVGRVVAGVDWSGSGTGISSRTVVWLWGELPNKRLRTLYFEVFPQANSARDVARVGNILRDFNVSLVACDAGEGAVANSLLRDILGEHRVVQIQYVGGKATTSLIKWNQRTNKYTVNRTAAIDTYMLRIKNKGVVFPNSRQMEIPFADMLAEYESIANPEGEVQSRIWLHSPTQPDDCLHAQIFGMLASQIANGEFEFY